MGEQDIRIIPLKCSQCGAVIEASEEEKVYYCKTCKIALFLNEDNLQPLPVEFASPLDTDEAKKYVFFPFWSFLISIELFAGLKQERFSQFSLFPTADGLWQYHIAGFWETDNFGYINRTSTLFMRFYPQYRLSSLFCKMENCVLSKKNAEELIELIFLSLESEKIVSLIKINYKINIVSYKIVGIPFYLDEQVFSYRDALEGKITIPVSFFNK